MGRKYKAFIKINIFTLIMIAISFGSVTFAWFAYSGLATADTEVEVKAWYIELEKDGTVVTNDINVSFADIMPGMDPITETITVNNLGDADAILRYSVVNARILGDPNDSYSANDDINKAMEIEDILAHDYPFRIDITTDNNIVPAKTGTANFQITISWPLDVGTNDIDTYWGNQAYYFKEAELAKLALDSTYVMMPSVQLELDLIAEQSLGSSIEQDNEYAIGTEILFNPITNTKCVSTNLSNCYTTKVMDGYNKVGDETVTLMPSFIESFSQGNYTSYTGLIANKTSSWTVTSKELGGEEILSSIATDYEGSTLKRAGLSDVKLGNLQYEDRAKTELQEGITGSGTYHFNDDKFPFLQNNTCYWTSTEIDATHAYALKTVSGETTMYPELKTTNCLAIPIMIVNKTALE